MSYIDIHYITTEKKKRMCSQEIAAKAHLIAVQKDR